MSEKTMLMMMLIITVPNEILSLSQGGLMMTTHAKHEDSDV